MNPRRALLLAACVFVAVSTAAAAGQGRPQTGTLRIVVKDPSGAVIPAALVEIRGEEPSTSSVVLTDVPSDGEGVAIARDLPPVLSVEVQTLK